MTEAVAVIQAFVSFVFRLMMCLCGSAFAT
jgi:hypothetical protein